MPATTNTPIRRTVGILTILALVAVFFSLYFFKYVPEQKRNLHQRAFSQLEQIKSAFNNRSDTYERTIRNYLTVDPSIINKDLAFLNPKWYKEPKFRSGQKENKFTVARLLESDATGHAMM